MPDTTDAILVKKATLAKMVQFINAAGRLINADREKSAAYRGAVGPTVDTLIANGAVAPTMKEKVAEQLGSDPEKALQFMVKLSGHTKPAELGRPENDGPAEIQRTPNGRVLRESDHVFHARMLGEETALTAR